MGKASVKVCSLVGIRVFVSVYRLPSLKFVGLSVRNDGYLVSIDVIVYRKSKMTIAKPEVGIARVLMQIEPQFQRHTRDLLALTTAALLAAILNIGNRTSI